MNRKETWPAQLGVADEKKKHQPNHYKDSITASTNEATIVQVEKDLGRTTDNELFKPGMPMRDALKRILLAYAAHDSVMGYVQSMNFIAAFLLLAGLEEEDVFWSLVVIVHKVIPGYFSEGMARAVLDGRVFGAFLHLYLPAIGLHVQAKSLEAGDQNMICGIISSQWLMKLFVNVIPDDATLAIWDLIMATRSRHPLFCASLALLETHAEQICCTPELGSCVQVMQEIPNELKSPEAVAAFATRLQAWSQKIDADHVQRTLGRDLGENGPQPGLEKAPDLVPLTDQAEVLAGCASGLLAAELRDVAAGNAEDPVATVASIQGDMQNIHALGGENSGNEVAILSDDEVGRLSEKMQGIITMMRDMPVLHGQLRNATHAACQVPLGTFLGSKLPKTTAAFQQQYKLWDDGVANVQKSRELSVGEGKSYWEAWSAGPTEALLAKAEDLQRMLEHATDDWKEVVIGVQHPEIGSASRKFEAKQGIRLGGGTEEIANVAGAAVAEHVKRVNEDIAAFRQDLAARAAEAKQLLPAVTANAQRLTSWLRDRSGKAAQGAGEWAAIMERRRHASANSFCAQLVSEQDAADKALQAAVAVASDAGQMGFKAEAAALVAFAASLDERKRVIARRQQRVEREAVEHAAVQKRAQDRSASDAKRADAAAASAAKCVEFLQRLAAPDLPQRGEAVAAAISALALSVAEVWKAKMVSYGEQIEMSKADLGMNYVILFNKADEDLGRLSEQIKAALKEATERELSRTSVRKEAMNMVKGLGKEGGFLSGFGFGKKEEPKPAAGAPAPQAPTTPPDVVAWEEGSPGAPGGAEDSQAKTGDEASASGEPRKKSKTERALEAEIQQAADRRAKLAQKMEEIGHLTQ